MHRKDTKYKVFVGCAFCPHRLQIPSLGNAKRLAVENGWGWLLMPSREDNFKEVAVCPDCLEKLGYGTDSTYVISQGEGND